MSSISNFLLTLAVAQATDATHFGAFSVAYLAYFLGLGLLRGLSLEPLLVSPDLADDESFRNCQRHAAGVVLGAVVPYAALMAAVGLVLRGTIGGPLLLVAACLPALFLQDTWRYVLLCQQRPAAAVANDALWCCLQLFGFVLLRIHGASGFNSYIMVWGASGAFCAAVGAAQAGLLPKCNRCTSWIRSRRALALPFAGEFLIYSGSGYVALLIIGPVSGLGGLGAFRALLALFGPPQVLVVGLNMAALSEGDRLLKRSRRRFCTAIVAYSAACGFVGAFWGVMLGALPASVGVRLLGQSWLPARSLLIPTTVFVALWNATAAPAAALKVLHAASQSLKARGFVCLLLVVLSLLGAISGGVRGAVIGFAISQGIGLGVWWQQFVFALRRSGAAVPPVPVEALDRIRAAE